MKINDGGSIDHEEENIEVLETPIHRAMEMIDNGEIKDGKTIMLLQYKTSQRTRVPNKTEKLMPAHIARSRLLLSCLIQSRS